MNTQPMKIDPAAWALLREAAEWRLVSLLLECPHSGWAAQVISLAQESADGHLLAAANASAEASPGLYHTTFGPGGPAAPREVSYHDSLLPGPILAELHGCYEAFAYRPSIPEPPDHIAVETGFISYLRVKEAYAQLRGDDEQRQVCHQTARWFLEAHLDPWAHALAGALQSSGVPYLRHTAAALLARVNVPCRPPVGLPIAPPDEDELACTC